MRDSIGKSFGRPKPVHPHAWLWERLESEPTFVLRSMFGAKAVYLDGKIVLGFIAREEPWHGILIATDRPRHTALRKDFPELAPHPILPKWLYLPESADRFERLATALVVLVQARDPRIGVVPKPRKKASKARRYG
jgi:hypothetical protein